VVLPHESPSEGRGNDTFALLSVNRGDVSQESSNKKIPSPDVTSGLGPSVGARLPRPYLALWQNYKMYPTMLMKIVTVIGPVIVN
jgi:hypothetical protein